MRFTQTQKEISKLELIINELHMAFIWLFVSFDYVFLISCFEVNSMQPYSAWAHHYDILGSGRRIVILAGVISSIRGDFLSPANNYAGFREFVDF